MRKSLGYTTVTVNLPLRDQDGTISLDKKGAGNISL